MLTSFGIKNFQSQAVGENLDPQGIYALMFGTEKPPLLYMLFLAHHPGGKNKKKNGTSLVQCQLKVCVREREQGQIMAI